MKELSIKEKSKRYEEALDEAKAIHKAIRQDLKPVIEKIFPELQELDDEQMWKLIKKYAHYNISDLALEADHITREYLESWLEKQGEQKSVEDSLTLEEFENAFITKAEQYDIDLPNRSWDIYALCKELYSLKHKPKQGEKNPAEWHIEDEQNLNACLGYIPDELLRRWLKDVIHAKYDKPINKLEAKFHEGDWVVTDKGDTVQIETVNNDYYTIGNGMFFSMPYVDTCWHSWTIQDAKDGDVLVCGDNPNDHHVEVIMLFKSLRNKLSAFTHFHIFCNEFRTDNWCDCGKNAHPASKEQRSLLFQKMKVYGYEWNADKKELKKL